jgi:hypothetical protein
VFDVLRIGRERGLVIGKVVMDSAKFIKLCRSLDVDVNKFSWLF